MRSVYGQQNLYTSTWPQLTARSAIGYGTAHNVRAALSARGYGCSSRLRIVYSTLGECLKHPKYCALCTVHSGWVYLGINVIWENLYPLYFVSSRFCCKLRVRAKASKQHIFLVFYSIVGHSLLCRSVFVRRNSRALFLQWQACHVKAGHLLQIFFLSVSHN